MAAKPDAWIINEADFPRSGSTSEKFAFCVRYAVLAPSTYNSQPWYFSIHDDAVHLYADRRYGLPVIDPEDRGLVISCGSALFNLRLAIRALGFNDITELLPDSNNPDLVARVRFGEAHAPSQEDRRLFEVICDRHGDRGIFSDKKVPDDVLRRLVAEVAEEGAWLHLPGESEKKQIARLTAEADHIQLSQKKFRRELAGWIHPRRILSGDGLPQEHLSYYDVMRHMGPVAIRRFEVSDGKPADDAQLETGSTIFAVLGGKAGGDLDRIYSGQALQRLWLRAQAEGLSVSTINQACEIPDIRIKLHDEINHAGRVHIILRIGYGNKRRFSDRRPMDLVLDYGSSELKMASEKSAAPKKGVFGSFGKLFLAKKNN